MKSASADEQGGARAPLISIVLPTYDRQHYLAETIGSIFGQTLQDWELIIVDDGSGTQTRAYLETLQGLSKVRLIWLPHSGTPAVARNAGIRAARGDYIAFMDSDDVWLPHKLECQLASLMQRTDRGWSQTSFLFMDAAGNPERYMPAADGWIFELLLSGETVIALPSVLISRSLLEELGGFNETRVTSEDYELWLRCALRSAVDAIPEPLTRVRRHQEHYGQPVGAVQNCLRVVDEFVDNGFTVGLESLVRRRRATLLAHLARAHVISRQRTRAFGVLFGDATSSCLYLAWWLALGVAISALAPSPARKLMRGIRARVRSSAAERAEGTFATRGR